MVDAFEVCRGVQRFYGDPLGRIPGQFIRRPALAFLARQFAPVINRFLRKLAHRGLCSLTRPRKPPLFLVLKTLEYKTELKRMITNPLSGFYADGIASSLWRGTGRMNETIV